MWVHYARIVLNLVLYSYNENLVGYACEKFPHSLVSQPWVCCTNTRLNNNEISCNSSVIVLRSTCGIGKFWWCLPARGRTTACKRGISRSNIIQYNYISWIIVISFQLWTSNIFGRSLIPWDLKQLCRITNCTYHYKLSYIAFHLKPFTPH